jgi:hypothetical protein
MSMSWYQDGILIEIYFDRFGGTLLGPQRFKDINQTARAVLEENNFISEPKKSKRRD